MDGGHLRWPEGAARVGPNAITQLAAVLDREAGCEARLDLFLAAGVGLPAPGEGMVPEGDVARLHHAVRQAYGDRATDLLDRAGDAVGAYLLANRIPAAAKAVIRALPKPLAERALTAAILKHGWTFAGSGRVAVEARGPLTLSVAANPFVALDRAEVPQCHWHSAVFRRLYATLVWPEARVTETVCCACGDPACRFEVTQGVRRA